MSTLILNGSPKKKLSMSRYIQKTVKLMLGSKEVKECTLHQKSEIPHVLEQLGSIDTLVITAPLYIDSIPSQLVAFLKEAEAYCKKEGYHFKVYVLLNSGFIEGHQNEYALAQYECWAERSGLSWGGGVGIGGGVILGFYTLALPIAVLTFMISLFTNVSAGMPLISQEMISSLIGDIGSFLFFSSGMFTCEWLIARRIKKQKLGKNLYTRFMCPTLIFFICADIFMMILCVFKGGIFRNVFHREVI